MPQANARNIISTNIKNLFLSFKNYPISQVTMTSLHHFPKNKLYVPYFALPLYAYYQLST